MKDVADMLKSNVPAEEIIRELGVNIDNSILSQVHVNSVGKSNQLDDWEKPVSFDEYELPPFPSNVFPEWLSRYVEAVAETTQTPKDMASIAAISVLSIATAKKFEINAYGSWIEQLNTYTITLMNPANRKSAVFELMTRPIFDHEKEVRELLKIDVRKRKEEIRALKRRLEHLINTNAKKPDPKYKTEVEAIIEEIEALPEIHLPTFILDDVTPEKLAQVLAENGEKVGIMSAEGGIFEIIRGRYTKELNMDIYLKGHGGDRAKVSRKGGQGSKGEEFIIENPALTIGIFAQPDVLQDLPRAFSGRGLMARFLYSLPKDFKGYRNIRPADIPSNVRGDYLKHIKRLMELQVDNVQSLTLSNEADDVFKYMQQEVETRLRDGQDLSEFAEWSGKIIGQLARIAALLHIAKHIVNGFTIPKKIEVDTIQSISRMKEYFISHAKAAFGCMEMNEELENLKYLLSIINRKAKEKYNAGQKEDISISYRDIQQLAKKHFNKSDTLKAALSELEQFGYIKAVLEGRKTIYEINPYIFREYKKASPNSPTNGSSFDNSAISKGDNKFPQVHVPPLSSLVNLGMGEKWGSGTMRDLGLPRSKSYNHKPERSLGEVGEQNNKNKNIDNDESELI